MAKGNSTNGTRGASSVGGQYRGWNISTDSRGFPEASQKGETAERIYRALNSSFVESAVEEQVGNIRSGGGISGLMSREGMTYSIIFRDGTTNAQIRDYLKAMDEGSKLYYAWRDSGTDKAKEAYDKWYKKMTGR